jgi:hypothetical protein
VWIVEEKSMAAPCGLYCGVCSDYLVNKECHGCFCECGECASAYHREECDLYQCCVEQRGYEGCHECEELPCSKLIRFCFDPVWTSHSPVIENLRRRKAVGTKEWLEEQKRVFSDEKALKRWLWLQKECEKRWKRSQEK